MSPPDRQAAPGGDESPPPQASIGTVEAGKPLDSTNPTGQTRPDPGEPGDVKGLGDANEPDMAEELDDKGAGKKRADKPQRRRGWLIETAVVLVVAVVVAVLLRMFVIQTFVIPSGSMEPTLQIGDRIVVNKLSYHLHAVHRGDVVVFKTPPAENCGGPPVPDLVKRVIGLPGEVISSRGSTVYINGRPLSEPWLPKGTIEGQPIPDPIPGLRGDKIPADDYFVMGDNRDDSCDSRDWGVVNQSLIVGRVVAIFWPFSRFHFF